MNKYSLSSAGLFSILLLAGPVMAGDGYGDKEKERDATSAQVTFLSESEETVGRARIKEGPEGVVIRLKLADLPEGWKAIHIHEKGTCDDHHEGFTASGGHLDPHDRKHGLLNPEGPEIGDLPNIYVNHEGQVQAEIYAPGVTLKQEGTGLLYGDGTALVIHEGEDDHKSQPIGGAGSRIACGVVKR